MTSLTQGCGFDVGAVDRQPGPLARMYPQRNGGLTFESKKIGTGTRWRAYTGVCRLRESEPMLDAFIIEEIKRRERSREERERPAVELPLPAPPDRPYRRTETDDDEKPQRGVVVIDL